MIIIFSLLLSAFFSGMEIAYVSSNRLNLEIEKNQVGLIPRLLSIITQNPSRFIATMLIGNNFALVIYGIFMGQFIIDNLAFINTSLMNELTIVLIQTLISTVVILVTAEFIPKVLFQIYSNISMKIFAIPAYFFYTIFYPITSLVTIISNFILKSFFKVNSDESSISFSKIELENYIENEIEKSDKNLDSEIEIFQNALELSEIKARDIMVPRAEIIALEDSTKIEKVKDLFIETGLSKIPIYKDSIDDIVGYIHSFDFLKKPLNIKEFILPVVFVPEPMLVNDVLEKLTIQRKSIAVVIDEYGGTSGIITVEDIVEELFGEIEDEHDNYDFYEKKISEDTYEFSSRLEIEYLNKTYNLKLPQSESYDTLGGLIVFNKEEIPKIGDKILIDNSSINFFSEKDPSKLPWNDLGVDIVFECTGFFTSKEQASSHIVAGAKKVLISAPAQNPDKTIVYGVNHDEINADDRIISNASCTTNCLAPIAKVINDQFGIKSGLVNTVHAATNDQSLLDVSHSDLYRARAASASIIPSKTGAAKAIGLVIPELDGKLNGMATRVPTLNVSMLDFTFETEKSFSPDELIEIIRNAANGEYKGILSICDLPLVSTDFNHNPSSSIFDTNHLYQIGNQTKILAWYDNEWGFSKRMIELCLYIKEIAAISLKETA